MVLGPKLALVLRAKSGGNFMLQTRGFPGKTAQDAVADALAALGGYAAERGAGGPPDGSGDAPPGFALGRVFALHGRAVVTYRMVGDVLALLVSEPETDAFTCLRTLDAAAKVLVGAARGVDVSRERLARRFLDLHAALGGLLDGGLAALPPAFVHASATDERLLALPLGRADAARRIKKLVETRGKSSSAFVPGTHEEAAAGGAVAAPPGGAGDLQLEEPETPARGDARAGGAAAGAAAAADPLGAVSFEIPEDALPPAPGRAAGGRRRAAPPPPPDAYAAPLAFAGALEEEAPAAVAEAVQEPAAPAAEEPDFGASAAPDAPPAPPPVSPADLRAALQLVELWRGEAAGGRLLRAGVEGRVARRLAPFGLLAARFRLLPSGDAVVDAHLAVAEAHGVHACAPPPAVDGRRHFVAALAGAPTDATFLRWALPAAAAAPPLAAELLLAPSAPRPAPGGTPRGPWTALVVVRWSAAPVLRAPLLDVVVELELPAGIQSVARVDPAAEWSLGARTLRWSLGRVDPGASGAARAVVAAAPGAAPAAAEAALAAGAVARLRFSAVPGRHSLSGLGFEVALPEGEEPKAVYHAGRALAFGELTVRP